MARGMSALPRLQPFVTGDRDDAPWVTFVPGIGNDASFWRAHADALSGERRTLRFHPWGTGESEAPPERCTLDHITAGIVQLWDELGVARSSVVGLGFGGSTALALALRYPGRVERVVACACRPRQPDDRRQFWRERRELARARGMAQLAEVTVARWLSPAFAAAHPDVAAALRAAFQRQSVDGYRAYVSAFIEMDLGDALAELRAPTLLVAAEHDHGGGPPEAMRALGQTIAGARLALVAGSGHLCNVEAPHEVARLLREFLVGGAR